MSSLYQILTIKTYTTVIPSDLHCAQVGGGRDTSDPPTRRSLVHQGSVIGDPIFFTLTGVKVVALLIGVKGTGVFRGQRGSPELEAPL